MVKLKKETLSHHEDWLEIPYGPSGPDEVWHGMNIARDGFLSVWRIGSKWMVTRVTTANSFTRKYVRKADALFLIRLSREEALEQLRSIFGEALEQSDGC
jgi:hypothetical protein